MTTDRINDLADRYPNLDLAGRVALAEGLAPEDCDALIAEMRRRGDAATETARRLRLEAKRRRQAHLSVVGHAGIPDHELHGDEVCT